MTNLFKETIESILASGHTGAAITFIGSSDGRYRCTWEEFEKLADREYDSGFGGAEVAGDLIIRFSDGKKMWRGEYDGSEWWEYDSPALTDYTQPGEPITNLIGGLWPSVQRLQEGED